MNKFLDADDFPTEWGTAAQVAEIVAMAPAANLSGFITQYLLEPWLRGCRRDRAGLASAHVLRPVPDTRGQELHPELPEDRGQSPVIGGSGLEDPGLGIVSTWVEGRSNDIGSKTGGPEAREPADPGVETNRRAQEPTGPWRKGQEVDKGTSPKSSG
ncbi:hypothetical protein DFH29DRAFT_872957 [Suillus ampliporus]|nr:hypothetical protein DFH29DRAFT_872957 [Suillus ampliporus]